METFKKVKYYLLTALGIFAIVELIRRLTQGDTDLDVSDLETKIKLGEEALKEIENANPDIDSIVDEWNSK